MKDKSAAVNLGLGDIQSVVASSTYTNTSVAKLFDNVVGDYTTGWHPATTSSPQYLQIRFVNQRKISTVSMIPRLNQYSGQFPKGFSIYGSNTVNPSYIDDISGMNLLFQTDGTDIYNQLVIMMALTHNRI